MNDSVFGVFANELTNIVEVLFAIVIMVIIFNTIRKGIKRSLNRSYFKKSVVIIKKSENNTIENRKYKRMYKDVPKSTLANFNTDDIDSLKEYFYGMFLEFENAYNNLDYNKMKILSTKQLYQNYYTGINIDIKAGKKKIISDIEKKNVILFELDSTIAKQTATLMIEISYINYTIDKNGYVVRGNKEKKITEKFEVSFRKEFERQEVIECPNCGAEVIGNRCDYCRSIIKNVDFKISSIKKIVDE